MKDTLESCVNDVSKCLKVKCLCSGCNVNFRLSDIKTLLKGIFFFLQFLLFLLQEKN
jgi:hypothetical protein